MERNRDNIVIGLMVILTYFLIYTFLNGSDILESLGGLPLINCVTDIIQNGFSGRNVAVITKDFGQTILIIYVVVFVQNLLPANNQRRLGAFVGTMIGYIVLYLCSMWVVRTIIFSSSMNEAVKMFLSILSVIMGGFGALFSTPLRRTLAEQIASQVLRDFIINSRVVQWLANSFYITCVILFLAVFIEITMGLSYFFTAVFAGIPSVIALIGMIICMYSITRVH